MKISPVSNAYSISYRAKMNEIYPPFKKEMTDYVLNDDISVSGIRNIVKKYSPNTSVRSMKNAPEEINHMETDDFQAYVYMPIATGSKKCSVKELHKTIYVDVPKKPNEEELFGFLNTILHENTHIFQSEADDRTNIKKLCDIYLKKENRDKILNSANVAQALFYSYERMVIDSYMKTHKRNSRLPKEVDNIEKQYEKTIGTNPKQYSVNTLDALIRYVQKENIDIDYNFIFDFIVMRAEDEKEAIENGTTAVKEALDIKNYTDLDFEVEMYDSMAFAANLLKDFFNTYPMPKTVNIK